jgi:hypothetical protein
MYYYCQGPINSHVINISFSFRSGLHTPNSTFAYILINSEGLLHHE